MHRKIVIIGFLLLTAIPFVFLKTFYPFFRFGMFAEPVKNDNRLVDEEVFVVRFQKNGGWREFHGTEIGLSTNVFGQMKRNFYYKNEAKNLLLKLQCTYPQSEEKWEFICVGTDTIKSQ